jgi:hypothetical protein
MFRELTSALAGSPEEISIDSTHIKVHRGGGKGGPLFKPLAAQKAGETPRFTP